MRKDQVHKSFLGVHYFRVGEIAKIEACGKVIWARVGGEWALFPKEPI